MSIPNQNIAKLHHYDNPDLNTEFERIYNFLQFAKYPQNSINGLSFKNGTIPPTKLILPLSVLTSLEWESVIVGTGGPTAGLGKLGTGPSSASQSDWVEIEVSGIRKWIPVWT